MSMALRVLCMHIPYLGIFLEKSHHFHQITQPVIHRSQEDTKLVMLAPEDG